MWRAVAISLLAAVPSSTNYVMPSYDFGTGNAQSGSSSYTLRGTAGSSGSAAASANYTVLPGVIASTTVPTPSAPTFTNPDNSYDRLRIVLQPGTAPSDMTYAIAISSDGFATTYYVKPDQTIGSSMSIANYQAYAAWGGASGVWIVGLASNTTYQVKVAALQGASTGSGFGPAASAATSTPSVTFSVATSLASTPPFSVNFASLPPGSPVTADATITATVSSNAAQGGNIHIKSQNGGLMSSRASYTITSATTDLTAAGSGYGAQVSSTAQVSGGPIVAESPFNGTGNSVGALSTTWQKIASFGSPVTTGAVTIGLMAKTDAGVPAAGDYTDTLTCVISLLF